MKNNLNDIKLNNKIIVKAKLLTKDKTRICTSDIFVEAVIEQIGDSCCNDYCNVNYICPKDGILKTSRYTIEEILSF